MKEWGLKRYIRGSLKYSNSLPGFLKNVRHSILKLSLFDLKIFNLYNLIQLYWVELCPISPPKFMSTQNLRLWILFRNRIFADLTEFRWGHRGLGFGVILPVRVAAIQKSTSNKCWRGCGEKGTLLPCWWECKLVQPLWKTVWRFL